ncbi:MAG: alanine--tRNA ligase [Candidatus Daviesbacteria bacterium]|nr:alanine--tRNA ligase [Candidatus Daviesbacteria bacterium]
MTSKELREKYLKFFENKDHKIIPSASLIPENDPSILFTTAGMHPLVPFLLGQSHPQGKRLVDVQKCVRTNDIDEVGDPCHHTFFEMLGNWSLGDPARNASASVAGGYWKKEAITFTFEFLTTELKINLGKLFVTCFAGDNDAPKDTESAEVWQTLGIPEERIFFNGKEENWWSSPGEIGPCGPDSEIFFDLTGKPCGENCQPGCSCGRFPEIGNNVFMEYNKISDGKFEKLVQRNVDFGGGFERILAVTNNLEDDYQTDLFIAILDTIGQSTEKKYEDNKVAFRIIADHLRAAVFIIADGVEPSNKERGYVLRRLIRRAILQLKKLGVADLEKAGSEIAETVIKTMAPIYPQLEKNHVSLIQIIETEIKKFNQTLEKGLKEFSKLSEIDSKIAFNLFQTYGFPVELTAELAKEKNLQIDLEEFKKEFEKHKELSRTASVGMFKGGLREQSEITTKYHTATHLLHSALRKILGDTVAQKGSNITSERLRFDFSYPEKLSAKQIEEIENLINQKIQENLEITSEVMDKNSALQSGALGFFTEKYGDSVTVYSISHPALEDQQVASSAYAGSIFSKEICGGPHVKNTGDLGTFKIQKEESAGSNLRRIYATLS